MFFSRSHRGHRALLPMAVALFGLGTLSAGCKEDKCRGEAPSFQLDLVLAGGASAAAVSKVVVTVTVDGIVKSRPLDSVESLRQGRASVRVDLGEHGKGGFVADVHAVATDSVGATLASGTRKLWGTGDACNFFEMALRGPTDGAPDVREGGSDLDAANSGEGDMAALDADIGPPDVGAVDRGQCSHSSWNMVVPRHQKIVDGGVSDAAADKAVGVDATLDLGAMDAATVDAAISDTAVPDKAIPDKAIPDTRAPDSSIPDAGTPPAINGMFLRGTTLFLVGDKGTVFKGTLTSGGKTTWQKMPQSATSEDLNAVWAKSATEVYAVGNNGAVILTTNGITWSPASFSTSSTKPTEHLRDIWGTTTPTNWVTATGDKGRVVQFQLGSSIPWASRTSAFSGHDYQTVWGTSDKFLFFGGQQSVSSDAGVKKRAVVVQWMDGAWTDISPVSPPIYATIREIRRRPNTQDIRFTAVGDSGTALRFSWINNAHRRFGNWTVLPGGVHADLRALVLDRSGVFWAAGTNRTVVRYGTTGAATVLFRGGGPMLTSIVNTGTTLWAGSNDGSLLYSKCQ